MSGRALVYVAHPVTCYGTAWEREALAAISEQLPDVELLDPSTRYSSTAAWLLDWPLLVGVLDGLVVFGDEDGRIGAGVLREIADVTAHDVPVAALDDQGRLCDLAGVDLLPPANRTPASVGWLVPGWPTNTFAGAVAEHRRAEHRAVPFANGRGVTS